MHTLDDDASPAREHTLRPRAISNPLDSAAPNPNFELSFRGTAHTLHPRCVPTNKKCTPRKLWPLRAGCLSHGAAALHACWRCNSFAVYLYHQSRTLRRGRGEGHTALCVCVAVTFHTPHNFLPIIVFVLEALSMNSASSTLIVLRVPRPPLFTTFTIGSTTDFREALSTPRVSS